MLRLLKTYGDVFLVFFAVGLLRYVLPLPYLIHVVLFSIYAMSFSFLLGRLGWVSFGQPAYLGIGAYATGLYLHYFGTNPYVGLLVGIIVGMVFAIAIGSLFTRLSSSYFTLANLALCAICFFLFQKALVGISRGDTGLWYMARMYRTPVLNLRNADHMLTFAILSAVVVWLIIKYLNNSVYGAACLAVKANETKLEFLGYNTLSVKWSGFVLANTIAAFSGSLYAIYLGFVSPAILNPLRVAEVVVVGLLGGATSLYGPIVGSFIYIAMQDLLSAVVQYWELFVGTLLVLVMVGGEKGVASRLEQLVQAGVQIVLRPKKLAGSGKVS
ncbi:MAG: branched-chain amino acid ABC transporter permease [Bacillota bacterium]